MIETTINAILQSNNPAKARAIRAGHSAFATSYGNVPASLQVNATRRVICEVDGDLGPESRAGDVWWYVPAVVVAGTTISGWMAERHKNEPLLSVTITSPVEDEPEEVDTVPMISFAFDPEGKVLDLRSTALVDLMLYEIRVDGKPFGEISNG